MNFPTSIAIESPIANGVLRPFLDEASPFVISALIAFLSVYFSPVLFVDDVPLPASVSASAPTRAIPLRPNGIRGRYDQATDN